MFTSGTADHHVDLLDKLRQWLTGTVGWTELLWSNKASYSGLGPSYSSDAYSSTAFAWKGNLLTPTVDSFITSVDARIQSSSGVTMRAAIVPASGGTITGTPIFSAPVTSNNNGWVNFNFAFDNPVPMQSGTQYAVMIGAIGKGGTYVLQIDAPIGASWPTNPWFTTGGICGVASDPVSNGNPYDTGSGNGTPRVINLNGYGAAQSITDNYYLVVKGPGAGAGREVYATFHSSGDAANSLYSIAIRAAIGYQAGAAWGANPGESPPSYLNLWQNPINYWFYANDRRIVIVAKCSTSYMSAYVGMFLPWADPTQYPFPLFVSADCGTRTSWNTVNSARRMFCDPGVWSTGAAGHVRDTDGLWQDIYNQQSGNSNDYAYGYLKGSSYFVWPWASGSGRNADSDNWDGDPRGATVGGAIDRLVPTLQGERLILPAHVNHTKRPMLGVLDGVYMPFGSGLVTEQTVTAAGKTLRAFQNIHRNSANDFFLIDEA